MTCFTWSACAANFPRRSSPISLELVPFSDAEHERLADIVVRTYAGSLDCPDLGNVRPIDEVLAGYRAVGKFDPARWLIARAGPRRRLPAAGSARQ